MHPVYQRRGKINFSLFWFCVLQKMSLFSRYKNKLTNVSLYNFWIEQKVIKMQEPSINALLDSANIPGPEKKDREQKLELIKKNREIEKVKRWWTELLPMVANVKDKTLCEWLKLALLGTCVGFAERNLLPQNPLHQYIFPRIIKDVTDMYNKLRQSNISFDSDYIKYQVYDFGIQWVYYMDWDVYMSQELY